MQDTGAGTSSILARIVTAMLARPVTWALGVAALTLAAILLTATQFQIEGDLAKALKGRSQAYADFQSFEERFGAPSEDEVYMVRAADFGDGEALTALEDLVIDLSLNEAVLGVMSLFSLPDPDGGAHSFLTRPDLAGLPDAERLDRVLAATPLAAQLLSADRTTTLVSVIPDRSIPPAERRGLLAETLAEADPVLTVAPVGLSEMQRTIAGALAQDLVFLLPSVILVCLVLSLAVFRSWRAAVICTLPAILGLIWTFAAAAGLGITFNAILAVAPAVLVVLGIADSIHVFAAIIRHNRQQPLDAAIVTGLRQTFPAVLLATLTTVIAFASLRIVGSPTLADLALVGGLGLVLMLVAVVLVVPLACRTLLAGGAETRRDPASFEPVSRAAVAMLRIRRPVAVLGVAILAVLAVVQSYSTAGYSITDHVPHRSDIRASLDILQEQLPGSDDLYVVVELPDPAPGLSEPDRERLRTASLALYGDVGAIPADLDDLPFDNASVQRLLGTDHRAFALPVPASLADDAAGVLARADAVRADLDRAGLDEVSTVTSYMLMSAVEIPTLVGELRVSFYIAVGFVTLLAVVLLRSVPLALMSLVPNLIPILGIEAALVLTGKPLTLTGAIGLTIAFGIAVDDTIHLLNRLRLARADLGHPTRAQVATAIRDIVPPVMISSLILFAGLGLTVFSAMPSAALFGMLVIAALGLALLADLFLFPSLLAWADTTETPP